MVTNIEFLKKRFDVVRQWCNDNGIVPQVSKLRTSEVLKDGEGTYEFNFQTKEPQFAGEVKLNRNDLFIPFQIGILLSFDAAAKPIGKTPLMSYARKQGAQYDLGFGTDDIEAFYNGTLIQTVNQTQIQQSFPCELFKWVPETQNALIADGSTGLGLQDEWRLEKALTPVVPNMYYGGNMDIVTRVEFNGTGSSFVLQDAEGNDSTDYKAYLNLVMYGVLAKNAAEGPALSSLKSLFLTLR